MTKLFKKAFYWFIELGFIEEKFAIWTITVLDVLFSIWLVVAVPVTEVQIEGFWLSLLAIAAFAFFLFFPVAILYFLGSILLFFLAFLLNTIDKTARYHEGPVPKGAIWIFCLTILFSFSLFFFLSFLWALFWFVELNLLNAFILGLWNRIALRQKAKREALVAQGA